MTNRSMKLADQSRAGEPVVQWPHTTVSSSVSDADVGPPLAQLLIDLDIKGTESDQQQAGSFGMAFTGTPTSVAIIEAGATAASKWWSAALAALGGGTAIWAGVSNFWKSQSNVQNHLVIGAAVIIAASALSIGLIMYGDVRARGQGAAAQYQARATIAAAFLAASPRPAIAAVNNPSADLAAVVEDLSRAVDDLRVSLVETPAKKSEKDAL
jgi:hypothetical protein